MAVLGALVLPELTAPGRTAGGGPSGMVPAGARSGAAQGGPRGERSDVRTAADRPGAITADRSRRRPQAGGRGGAPARIVFLPEFREVARDLREGDEVLVLTWLHQGRRDVLSVRPRGDSSRTLTGVFATRSSDRPNPTGLHAVAVEAVEEDAITRSATWKRSTAPPSWMSGPFSAERTNGDVILPQATARPRCSHTVRHLWPSLGRTNLRRSNSLEPPQREVPRTLRR